MKRLKCFFQGLGQIAHFFVNGHLLQRWKDTKHIFYTGWVRQELASCGENTTFWGFTKLVGARYVHVGNGLRIGQDCVWELYDERQGQKFTPSLIFGDGSSFGDGGHISCINRVTIGCGVRIGRKVFITDNNHGVSDRALLDTTPNLRPLFSKGPVVIEDNVWIGEMVCIMPGVTIGRGAIIGANAVVTHDVPPYCVAAGNPARIIKRLDETC